MVEKIPNLPGWSIAWLWAVFLGIVAIRSWRSAKKSGAWNVKRDVALLFAVGLWLAPIVFFIPAAIFIFPALPTGKAFLLGGGICLIAICYYDRVLKP